jgi:hypothetical protein
MQMEGDAIDTYCRHSLFVSGDAIPWVAASGIRNARRLTMRLRSTAEDPPVRYSVRLCFSEPGEAGEGQRLFDVSLQGKKAVEKLDVRRRTGGPLRGMTLRFDDVLVKDVLTVELAPVDGSRHGPVLAGIECIEQQAVVLGAVETVK